MCNFVNGIDKNSNKKILDILKEYGNDYVVQKKIKNCQELKKLNSSSVNTLRVITYILNGNIYHMPVILRIGRLNSNVDNAHAGGMFIGVTDDGFLLKTAHTEFAEKYDCHPDSKVVFEGYHIPQVLDVIEYAKKLHCLIPHVGCVNWDFTIDDNENIILLEANIKNGSIWLIQMAHGKSCFGDNTDKVLNLVRNNKILY